MLLCQKKKSNFFKEKPIINKKINAGIYVIKKKHFF